MLYLCPRFVCANVTPRQNTASQDSYLNEDAVAYVCVCVYVRVCVCVHLSIICTIYANTLLHDVCLLPLSMYMYMCVYVYVCVYNIYKQIYIYIYIYISS